MEMKLNKRKFRERVKVSSVKFFLSYSDTLEQGIEWIFAQIAAINSDLRDQVAGAVQELDAARQDVELCLRISLYHQQQQLDVPHLLAVR